MDSSRSEISEHRHHFIDLTPLRASPAFARLWIGGAVSGIGGQMTVVAVGLRVYDLTHSTLAVSLVALFALGPMIIFGLYGGVLADSYDRRSVATVTAIAAWVSIVGIALLTWIDVRSVLPLYVLTTINAVATIMIGGTRQAITPRLLPATLLPAASALNGISNGVMLTLGPALAGVLAATIGIKWTFTSDAILFSAAFIGIVTLPSIIPERRREGSGIKAITDGLRFLSQTPQIGMTFLLDMIAMTFGQPRALFPAIGALLLGGGPITVGILTAAGAVGTLISSVFSGRLGSVRYQGRAVEKSIMTYGLALFGFGIVLVVTALSSGESTTLKIIPLTIAAVLLAMAGAADNISSIFRMTILQASTPDHMQGRLQGIFTVVVTSGPRLGDLYVGILALSGALWFPPLLGGILIVVLVSVSIQIHSGLHRYDATAVTQHSAV